MEENRETKIKYPIIISCFILYILVLICLIVFKNGSIESILGKGYSLDPITMGIYMRNYCNQSLNEKIVFDLYNIYDNFIFVANDIFANIVLFIPYGLIVPFLFKKHIIIKTIISGFLFSVIFELIQLFTGFGQFSFLDMTTNTLGTELGLFILLLLVKFIKKEKLNKIINITVTICFVIGLIYFSISLYKIFTNIDIIIFKYDYCLPKIIKELKSL